MVPLIRRLLFSGPGKLKKREAAQLLQLPKEIKRNNLGLNFARAAAGHGELELLGSQAGTRAKKIKKLRAKRRESR